MSKYEFLFFKVGRSGAITQVCGVIHCMNAVVGKEAVGEAVSVTSEYPQNGGSVCCCYDHNIDV